jgi:hypothetical protein
VIASEQIDAATELETTFRAAAARVDDDLSSPALPTAQPLSEALIRTADSYGELGQAVAAGNRDGYDAAREAVDASETDLDGVVRRELTP